MCCSFSVPQTLGAEFRHRVVQPELCRAWGCPTDCRSLGLGASHTWARGLKSGPQALWSSVPLKTGSLFQAPLRLLVAAGLHVHTSLQSPPCSMVSLCPCLHVISPKFTSQ